MSILTLSQVKALKNEIKKCEKQYLELKEEIKNNAARNLNNPEKQGFDGLESRTLYESFLSIQQELKRSYNLLNNSSIQKEYQQDKIGIGTVFDATISTQKGDVFSERYRLVDVIVSGDNDNEIVDVTIDSPMGEKCIGQSKNAMFSYFAPSGQMIATIDHICSLEEIKDKQHKKTMK